MVVSRNAGGQNPVKVTYEFTLTQRLDLRNDPTNFQKRPATIAEGSAIDWALCRLHL